MSQNSPVVLSQYDPSGQYYAYVTVALDKQRISVEPTTVSKSSLINDNFLYLEGSGVTCTSIQWIALNDTPLVALGLNQGEIWLYSPLSNEIVAKLQTGNTLPVKDFQIDGTRGRAWCLDGGDNVFLFDMVTYNMVNKFHLDECKDLTKLCVVDENKLLLASHQIFLVDVKAKAVVTQFPGHISPVNFLKLSFDGTSFLSGSKDDRFLNIYDLETSKTKAVLVAHSNVTSVSVSTKWNSVSITNEEGEVEIFEDPLINAINGSKRRAGKISKQSSKYIKLTRNESKQNLILIKSFIDTDIINLTWLENATVPYFDQLKLDNLTEVMTSISKPLPSVKSSKSRNNQNSDISSARFYKEGNATVTSGDNFKHVESIIHSLNQLEDGESATDSLQDKLNTIAPPPKKNKDKKRATAGTSTVVLSQALKSNDHALLETVLNTRDEKVIQATITRLSPQLATILLERLAERIARQTHRQGPLNVWVKWCLIIHGGYLVTIPNLISSLSSLHSTLKKRADLLPRLTALDTRITRCLNELENKRAVQLGGESLGHINNGYEHDSQLQDENTSEEDVEYIEELDDAGLIEDGEEGEDYSEEDSDEELPQTNNTKEKFDSDDEDDEMNIEVEEGYSDEEV